MSTHKWKWVAAALIICIANAQMMATSNEDKTLKPWRGQCGQCLFQDARNQTDGGSGCMVKVYREAVEAGNAHWNNYQPMDLCLGYIDMSDKKPTTPMALVNNQSTAEVTSVNLFAHVTRFSIDPPEMKDGTFLSSFAKVGYANGIDTPAATWLIEAGVPDARASTVALIRNRQTGPYADWLVGECYAEYVRQTQTADPGDIGKMIAILTQYQNCMGIDGWENQRCTQKWPFCVPNGWQEFITSGALPGTDNKQHLAVNPVHVRSIWCTETGISNAQPVADRCGPKSCNYDPFDCKNPVAASRHVEYCSLPRDSPERNVCLQNGLCRCNKMFAGSQCERYLNGSLAAVLTTPLPLSWRRGDEKLTDLSVLTWGTFFTCDTFDPCSGGCILTPLPFGLFLLTCRCRYLPQWSR
jgi:hypothetical protein